jgi:hypothetical protein
VEKDSDAPLISDEAAFILCREKFIVKKKLA